MREKQGQRAQIRMNVHIRQGDACLLPSSFFFSLSFMNQFESVPVHKKKNQAYLLGVRFDDWRRVASSLLLFIPCPSIKTVKAIQKKAILFGVKEHNKLST